MSTVILMNNVAWKMHWASFDIPLPLHSNMAMYNMNSVMTRYKLDSDCLYYPLDVHYNTIL